MKHLILFISILFYATITIQLNAQEISFTVETEKYIFDTNDKILSNAINEIYINYQHECQYYYSKTKVSELYPIIIDIFTRKEVKTFAEDNISILLFVYCDWQGYIKEIRFSLGKMELTKELVKKLHAAERRIIGQKIDISTVCSEMEYYYFTFGLNFKKIYATFKN